MPPSYKNGSKKVRRKLTAKELANLKPIKKGEVRNPNGARTHNPLLRAFKNLHQDSFREVLHEVLESDDKKLDALCAPTDGNPSLRRLIAKAMQNAISHGEYGLVERITERLFGKVPDQLNLKSDNLNTSINYTEIQILEAIKKIKSNV